MQKLLSTYISKLTQLLLAVTVFSLLLACSEMEEPVLINQLDFEIEEIVKVGDEVILETNSEDFETLEWTISDGSSYQGDEVVHTFSNSGRYLVTLSAYRNGQVVLAKEKIIEVLGSHKLLQLEENQIVQKAIFTEGRIVLNSINSQNQSSFLFVNNQLEVIKEVYGVEGINSELETAFSLGDSIIAFSEKTTQSYTYLKYKSSVEGAASVNSGFINYNNGIIRSQTNCQNQLYIEYFTASTEKLWSKTFKSNESKGSAHLCSLNSRLYYLNFSGTEDAVYIEKFNNPSVIFKKENQILSSDTKAREVLFVADNPIVSTITFALYSAEEDVSTIYSVDEACTIRIVTQMPGRFEISSKEVSSVGDFTVTADNMVAKYSRDWELLAEYPVSSNSFGTCQLGDNLILLYENLPSGSIRLSYLNKNLEPVYID